MYLNAVNLIRQSTVYNPIASVFNPKLGELSKKERGLRNAEAWFNWSASRHLSSRHSGCRRRDSRHDKRHYVNELYGIHHNANCRATIPVARSSISLGGYSGLHDVKLLKVKRSAATAKAWFDWTASRNTSSRNRGRSSRDSRHDKRVGDFDECFRRWLQLEQRDVLVGSDDVHGSAVVPVASSRASVSGYSGLHDFEPVSGVDASEAWFDWSPRWNTGCSHSSCRGSDSRNNQRNQVGELYGLYDYANCGSTVPAARCSVGSSWNRWLHDVKSVSATPFVFPSLARTLNAPPASFLYYCAVSNSMRVN